MSRLGAGSGGGVAERGERGEANLLVRLRGTGDDGAGKIGGQAFVEPLLRQWAQITARHIDHAGRVFALLACGGIGCDCA